MSINLVENIIIAFNFIFFIFIIGYFVTYAHNIISPEANTVSNLFIKTWIYFSCGLKLIFAVALYIFFICIFLGIILNIFFFIFLICGGLIILIPLTFILSFQLVSKYLIDLKFKSLFDFKNRLRIKPSISLVFTLFFSFAILIAIVTYTNLNLNFSEQDRIIINTITNVIGLPVTLYFVTSKLAKDIEHKIKSNKCD